MRINGSLELTDPQNPSTINIAIIRKLDTLYGVLCVFRTNYRVIVGHGAGYTVISHKDGEAHEKLYECKAIVGMFTSLLINEDGELLVIGQQEPETHDSDNERSQDAISLGGKFLLSQLSIQVYVEEYQIIFGEHRIEWYQLICGTYDCLLALVDDELRLFSLKAQKSHLVSRRTLPSPVVSQVGSYALLENGDLVLIDFARVLSGLAFELRIVVKLVRKGVPMPIRAKIAYD